MPIMNNQILVILCIDVELEPQCPDSESGILSVSIPTCRRSVFQWQTQLERWLG